MLLLVMSTAAMALQIKVRPSCGRRSGIHVQPSGPAARLLAVPPCIPLRYTKVLRGQCPALRPLV